jgi:chemotaxis protein MotA
MQKKSIDLSTIIGITLSVVMVFIAISIEGSLGVFIDLPSFLIVIMGTLLITIACFSFADVGGSVSIIYNMVFFKTRDLYQTSLDIINFAESARKKTTLQEIDLELNRRKADVFFKKYIKLAIDGMAHDNLEKIISQEIISKAERNNRVVLIMKKAGETSPAMGLIGTLIGLVQMLSNLNDPSKLGPSMAIALLTTFYGAILSYMLFFPLASKIERNSREEILLQKIYLKSVLSIAKRENPRHLETVINSLLDPTKKVTYFKA